jgi:hypothetical protein
MGGGIKTGAKLGNFFYLPKKMEKFPRGASVISRCPGPGGFGDFFVRWLWSRIILPIQYAEQKVFSLIPELFEKFF